MKAILISIRPQWVAKILNGEKTIEIRRKFPKDYVGWVYIYCTKNGEVFKNASGQYHSYKNRSKCVYKGRLSNGVVVARFWCDKVEEIESCQVPFTYEQWFTEYWTKTFSDMEDLLKASCLDYYTLDKYLEYSKNGYAIHITKLEIFGEAKDLKNFLVYSHTVDGIGFKGEPKSFQILKPLIKAPQSWRYIEE